MITGRFSLAKAIPVYSLPSSESVGIIGIGTACIALGAALAITDRIISVGATLAIIAGAIAIGIGFLFPYAAALGALALVSFDAFLNAQIGTLTVKSSTILFGAALIGLLFQSSFVRRTSKRPNCGVIRPILWALAAISATHVISYFVGGFVIGEALPRFLVIVGGAIVPIAVLLIAIDTPERFHRAVNVVIGAMMAVCLYGLYQLGAPHFGLPQGLQQTATVAGSGRISAFSLEPGYFAAYLVTGLPLVTYLTISRARRRSLRDLIPGLLIVTTLILANARTGYVGGVAALVATLGLLVVTRVLEWPGLVRIVAATSLVIVVITATSSVLDSNVSRTLTLQVGRTIQPNTIVDPTEMVSNRQRLELYGAAYRIFLDHPLFGVGDTNAVAMLPRYGAGLFYGEREGTVNNVPLGVAAGTGVLGLAALALLYLSLGHITFRPPLRGPMSAGTDGSIDPLVPQMVLLGALVLLVVNGLFNAWLWDLRLWTAVGLGLSGLALVGKTERADSSGAAEAVDNDRARKVV